MRLHHGDERVTLWHGDCLEVLRSLPDASVDSVVTDPPYNLSFMGREWDSHVSAVAFQQWCELWATECLRALKPGGHLISFGGTRTWHRLACAVEDAGFEVRDSIAWMYGSGFPKSHDVSKHIDRTQGAERPRTKEQSTGKGANAWKVEHGGQANHWIAAAKERGERTVLVANDDPITDDAQRWQGWGTALKPAFEPVVVARKPLSGTVAANVLAHGTGALNIDGCRVEGGARPLIISKSEDSTGILGNGLNGSSHGGSTTAGRWPANVLLDDSQAAELDRQSGDLTSGANPTRRGSDKFREAYGDFKGQEECTPARGADSGGASRFFPTFRYEAKAPSSERPRIDGVAHPTVKPLDLMRWLVRLVTPPGGTVLEPFAGSGTTVEAAIVEGFHCIAIEREADYLPLIMQRVNRRLDPVAAIKQTGDDLGLFDLEGEGA